MYTCLVKKRIHLTIHNRIANWPACIINKFVPTAKSWIAYMFLYQTNMTCGVGNIYTAFSNAYPGESYYETVHSVSPGNPTSVFHNSSRDQTLFINLVDALKNQATDSTGCTITITPFHGDHTDHSKWWVRSQEKMYCTCTYWLCKLFWDNLIFFSSYSRQVLRWWNKNWMSG